MESVLEEKFTLIDLLDPAVLKDACEAYAQCFNLDVHIVSRDGEHIISVERKNPFCSAVHDSGMADKCKEVRAKLFKHPIESTRVFQTKAFCGMKYSLFPLTHEFENLGRVVIGPFLEPGQDLGAIPPLFGAEGKSLPFEQLKKIPVIGPEQLRAIIRLLAKFLDAFLFVNAKRLITTRLHLDTIYSSRESIFRQVELQDSGTKEDKEEIEKLKNMF